MYKEIQQAYFNATAEQEKYLASEKIRCRKQRSPDVC